MTPLVIGVVVLLADLVCGWVAVLTRNPRLSLISGAATSGALALVLVSTIAPTAAAAAAGAIVTAATICLRGRATCPRPARAGSPE